ncbi:MAG: hypothetical protein H6673_11015 [Anaerolineales bacterium]|nr:hypothetical protein [Anaerolineales bacterium]
MTHKAIRIKLKKWLERFALLGISTLVTLVLLEFVVRLFFPQQLIVLRPDVWIPSDEGIGYKHQANLDTKVNTGERTVRLLTDENGYRIGERRTQEPDMRILAVGDSFLEALQVEYDETFTAILEDALSTQLGLDVQIVNTGVSGYSPNHYGWIVRHELPRQTYAAVLVFIFVDNDVVSEQITDMEPLPPGQRHHFRLPDGLSFGAWKESVFYPINDSLERHSQLYILLKHSNESFLARLGLTARYFPNAMLKSYQNSPDWDVTADIFESIQTEAEAQGIETIYIILPSIYQIEEREYEQYTTAFNIDRNSIDLEQPQRILRSSLEARGLIVVDTTPAMLQAKAQGAEDLFGKVDDHFGSGGHQVVADVVFPIVLSILDTN